MKVLKRKIMREYEKRGKSPRYHEMKKTLDEKLRSEKIKYKDKVLNEVCNGTRNAAYAAIKKLGARPGENNSSFTLPEHDDLGLTAYQSAERIAEHFAKISNTYEPIDITKFPPNIRQTLTNPDLSVVPRLTEYDVFKKLCKAKKPNSSVPGDLPKKIVQEFTCELAYPVMIIFNSILATLEYPRQWVKEYQIPLPKASPPLNEDQLRNIAKTAFLSKCFESFLADWLLPIVSPFIDPCQYGLKGGSITHYLLQLMKFTHEFLDLKTPHAVLFALVDQSKAFNRVSHQMVVEDLHAMKVPSWILVILVSYLSGRSMTLYFKGACSSRKMLPGSSPQGAFLGIFLFIIKFNGAALRPEIPRISFNCDKKLSNCKEVYCRKHPKQTHAIYVDDLAEAEALNLKQQLIDDPVRRDLPLKYHERTHHIFPAEKSLLQKKLLSIEDFSNKNLLKINESKTKIMIFNTSRKFDFPPELSFANGQILDVVNETLLLGIKVTTDLRWNSNTQMIFKKAMSKMWLLRRMKSTNIEPEIILDYYIKEIRIIAEHGVAIWNSGLTVSQVQTLEKIQKVALKIIMGDRYTTYEKARINFGLKLLSERREDLCINYALKLFKSKYCSTFFTPATQNVATRNKNLVVEPFCNTKKCYLAPHSYLARLVNQNSGKLNLRS